MNKKINLKLISIGFFCLVLGSSAHAASFEFDPANGSLTGGCIQSLDLYVDPTGQSSNAGDIEIIYDQNLIEIIDSDPGTTGTQIEEGDAYEEYYGNIVESDRIRLTGASFVENLTIRRKFATIHFEISTLDNANINFTIVFTPGSTTDSNIADSNTNEDLLASVTHGEYTVARYCGTISEDDGERSASPTPNITISPTSTPLPTTSPAPGITTSVTPMPTGSTVTPVTTPGATQTLTQPDDKVNIADRIDQLLKQEQERKRHEEFERLRRERDGQLPGGMMAIIRNLVSDFLLIIPGMENIIYNPELIPILVVTIILIATLYTAASHSVLVINPILIFTLVLLILGKKSKKPHGTIYDLKTNNRIPFVVLKFYSQENNQMIDNILSDKDGRFGIKLSPGKYKLKVMKPGYKIYSDLVEIPNLDRAFNIDIFLINKSSDRNNQLIDNSEAVFKLLIGLIFLFGLLLAIINITSYPTLLNTILFGAYVIILLIYITTKIFDRSKKT